MSSKSSLYRLNNPEIYEKEKKNNNQRNNERYKNDVEYRERIKRLALERYYNKIRPNKLKFNDDD